MENQTTTENRKHKDSLFVDYFSKDRDWKQHFLSLYNALHGTNLQVETTKLERVNLEQVLYMDYYNDIAIMVNDQFILMIEHQATINPNMPLRLLEYISRIYGNMVDSKAKFSDKLIPLAKPEFFVFYTGNQDLPPESYLYLSDAFCSKKISDETPLPGVLGAGSPQAMLGKDGVLGEGKPRFRVEGCPSPTELTLELKVKVCKIKSETPSPVVQNCPDLEQYVQFLKLIDEAKSDGQAQPLTRAIREAVRHNILRDYLERKGGETLSILTAEYDFDTAMAVKQEEAYEEGLFTGREEGISIGLEQGRLEGLERGAYQKALETARKLIIRGYAPEDIADVSGLSLSQVQELLDS